MIERKSWLPAAALALAIAVAGCADPRNHTQAVYVLVDTSGTYAQEAGKARLIINYLLGTLQSGDSLAVARVQSRSFSEKDIIAKVMFDQRPTQRMPRSARSARRPTRISGRSGAAPTPTSPAASSRARNS